VDEMSLFPIFALSFSNSVFNINTVLLSTTEHFKISGSCLIFHCYLNYVAFYYFYSRWVFLS
jgi:hypothetical protein